MDDRRCGVLGKRDRREVDSESSEDGSVAFLKRTKTKGSASSTVTGKSSIRGRRNAKTRSGLLTPESSFITEAQTSPTASDDPTPPHHTFPFMRLPAELRLHIYYMALVRDEPLLLHTEYASEKSEEDTPSPEDGQTVQVVHNIPGCPLPIRPDVRRQRPIAREEVRVRLKDPISPELLRANKLIYKEAHQILYSENVFKLSLDSGIHTLSSLHQRSRSLIRHVVLTIPSHHDILDGFADLVRLGLRYCWGLRSFRINLKSSLPDDNRTGGPTSVYANAFHILRWLPRGCSVVLDGCISETVRRVVVEEGRLMNVLDEKSYLKRQHQMPERH